MKHLQLPPSMTNFFSWACAKWHCSQVRSLLFAEQSRRPSSPVTCGLSYPSFQVTPLGRAKAMKTHPSVAWLQEGCRNRFLLKPAVSQGLEMWRDIKSGSCWKGTYLLCKTCFLSVCKTFRISVGTCHGQVFSREPFAMPVILKKRDFASSESFW